MESRILEAEEAAEALRAEMQSPEVVSDGPRLQTCYLKLQADGTLFIEKVLSVQPVVKKRYIQKIGTTTAKQVAHESEYRCRTNANGKRLTAKSGTVKAREFYVNARVQENGKEVTKAVKAGYIFRNSETLKTNIIVLVPKGERPVIQCTVNNLPEL